MHLPSCFIFTGCQHKPAVLWWTWEWFYSHVIFRELQLGIKWISHSSQSWIALFKRRGCYELQFQFSALLSQLHPHLLFSVLYPVTCLWIWGLPNCSEVFNKKFAYLLQQMQSEEFWNEKQKEAWKCHWRTLSVCAKTALEKEQLCFF